jgi:hypothetical protein
MTAVIIAIFTFFATFLTCMVVPECRAIFFSNQEAQEEQGSTGPVTQPTPEPTEAPFQHPETPAIELPAVDLCTESQVPPTDRERLPDTAYVVRGGIGTAEFFAKGAKCRDEEWRLMFVSVNSAPGVPWQILGTSEYKIKNNQITYTTVGDVRAAGGDVIPDREPDNPYHALMFGLTPFEAERVFLENGLHPRPG